MCGRGVATYVCSCGLVHTRPTPLPHTRSLHPMRASVPACATPPRQLGVRERPRAGTTAPTWCGGNGNPTSSRRFISLSLSPPMSSHPSTSVESSSDRLASYLTSLHIVTHTLTTASHHGYRIIGITLPASSHHQHHHHHIITVTALSIIIITRGCELGSRCGFVYSWCGPSARAGLVT